MKWQHRSRTEAIGETPFRRALLGTRGLGKEQRVIDTGHAYARVKHRARMLVLYYFAELENRLVVGTTNRSEAMTGFVVKWGDNVADIEPILPLYKTQVRRLATFLDVPEEIIRKAPTPDLLPGIVDEMAMGIDYETLDRILEGLDKGWDAAGVASACAVPEAQVRDVEGMVRRSRHMRELPPSPDLGASGTGGDRRRIGAARTPPGPAVAAAPVPGTTSASAHHKEVVMTSSALTDDVVGALRSRLAGEVIAAGDEEYDAARAVWNGMIDKRPAAIVRCRTQAGVAATIDVARAFGLPLAIRGGGHNVAGLATSEGGVVIDLSAHART